MARVSPRRSSSSSSTSSCSRARRSPPPAGRDSASPSVARSSRDTPGGSGPRTPPTAVREFARKGYDPALGSSAVVWAAVGGIVGARLWLVLDAWPEFVRAPADFLWNGGGFVFYGGLVGGALAVTIFFRRAGIPWLRGADVAAPAIALGQAIGRLGCPLAGGVDVGKEPTQPWGMAYACAVGGWDKP